MNVAFAQWEEVLLAGSPLMASRPESELDVELHREIQDSDTTISVLKVNRT
jgi:hypothetical protein